MISSSKAQAPLDNVCVEVAWKDWSMLADFRVPSRALLINTFLLLIFNYPSLITKEKHCGLNYLQASQFCLTRHIISKLH